MTVILSNPIIHQIALSPAGSLSNGLGLVAVTLLLVLLIERVLLEAFMEKPRPVVVLGFNIAMIPLIFILGVLLVFRFAMILGLIRV